MVDIDDIADVVATAVKAATTPLAERIDAQAKLIADLEARELPEAIKGEPGEVDMEAVQAILDDLVRAAFDTIPVPQDGRNGIGLADALIDRDGTLVLTLTDGRTKTLGRVVGRDGENGKAGQTFTLDDFDIVQGEDDRTFKFCFTNGNEMHSFEFAFPVVLDRGVWKEGTYQHGDAVTWAGSFWIAQRATDAKPDSPDSGWRLAVKRGRDGKDAR